MVSINNNFYTVYHENNLKKEIIKVFILVSERSNEFIGFVIIYIFFRVCHHMFWSR